MEITKIELYNFGSYEGHCVFDFSSDDPDKRIIVIGGKNGAGKTTLFTAIQLCLYGNYAFGYKSAGHLYLKEVYNLINSKARIMQDESSFIKVSFQHTNARERTNYEIKRSWTWETGEIEEMLNVIQNGIEMEEDDISSFQNYLIHLVPPDMLKLYFFDGEKIADYFLSENKINIRDALMILSGNDTFDILYTNVRRVLNINKDNDSSEISNQYLVAQDELDEEQENLTALENMREELVSELTSEESKLVQMQSDYKGKGGITLEQLNELQTELKLEEGNREKINAQRKNIATDILPFVILEEWVDKIQPQIDREDEFADEKTLESKLSGESFRSILTSILKQVDKKVDSDIDDILDQIKENLLPEDWSDFTPILELSKDDKIQVQSVLGKVYDYDRDTLRKLQEELDKSLKRTKDIRSKINSHDAEHISDYIKETTQLEGEIKLLQTKIEQADLDIEQSKEKVSTKTQTVTNTRKLYENSLKKTSVSSLSGRILLMLEELQNEIYSKLIRSVETDLKFKLHQLMRKTDFFDDIVIDSDFNVHILKDQIVSVNDLIQIVRKGGQEALRKNIGDVAVEKILDGAEDATNSFLISLLNDIPKEDVELPVEINKESMSSGEKQIFVMSLYWAIMQQSTNEMPFIIDTPFARIDTEHRENITEHFFLDLDGQLFILSTNEELRDVHLSTMQEQISHTYLLECGEDKRTRIYQDSYFEV